MSVRDLQQHILFIVTLATIFAFGVFVVYPLGALLGLCIGFIPVQMFYCTRTVSNLGCSLALANFSQAIGILITFAFGLIIMDVINAKGDGGSNAKAAEAAEAATAEAVTAATAPTPNTQPRVRRPRMVSPLDTPNTRPRLRRPRMVSRLD